MKIFVYFLMAATLMACSNSSFFRSISSVGSYDLSGTYLGVAKYKFGRKGPNKAAVRVYLDPAADEAGAYNLVILEYIDIVKIAPQYIASRSPINVNRVIGYLNDICRRISVYKVRPTSTAKVFELQKMRVINGKIEHDNKDKPSLLKLNPTEGEDHPLAGATITASKHGEPVSIFFPPQNTKENYGFQHSTTSLVYKKANLDSTWRKNYLPGPYLAAYGKLDDVVLKLSRSATDLRANFVINEKYADTSPRRRRRIFTNPKSAFLEGQYKVNEPVNGMFVFEPSRAGQQVSEHLAGRIGLFIDIFDATRSLNQDVVELAIINPDDPEDFLMYYEHPENGEGDQ